jgi:nucleoside-diphosphate-sugar epimerase
MENGVKKLVFASSISYYGLELGVPIQLPVVEDGTILTQRVKAEELPSTARNCDIAYSTSKVIGEQILANYGMRKKFEVIILRLGPVRPKGVYEPRTFGFDELKLHLKIENALQAFENAIESDLKLWYEAFTIVDEVDGVDILKARNLLNYKPI